MGKLWKQVLMGAVLGWVMPQMIFRAGFKTQLPTEQQPMPEQTEMTSAETVAIAQTEQTDVEMAQLVLPVVMDGETVLMELDTYIRGVVLAEMPTSFELEALKAQAVASRTYTIRRLTLMDKHSDGAVCTKSSCCQAYISDADYLNGRGTQTDIDKVIRAVTETTGQILTYKGSVIEATYFAASGGRTEDAAAVWGSDIPYLQAVDSPGETKAEKYDEKITYTRAEFSALLGIDLTGNGKNWVESISYTDGGGVKEVTICGQTYSGTQMRKLLGLNSTLFTISVEEGTVAIETRGWGHRVGMSQYGADVLAVKGFTYDEILQYYYQQTQIDKITDLK